MWIFDTDVIVAAIRSRTGAAAAVVRSALLGQVEIGLSVALLLEYEAVATRPEHVAASGMRAEDILEVIDTLASVARPVHTYFLWRPQLRDADDEMVLEAAVNGRASAIVTFNRRDFADAAGQFGIEILLPKQALETLR